MIYAKLFELLHLEFDGNRFDHKVLETSNSIITNFDQKSSPELSNFLELHNILCKEINQNLRNITLTTKEFIKLFSSKKQS